MKNIFINEAITQALEDYLKSKEEKGILFNSFLVVCIRLLIVIYSESDILNPYNINNPDIWRENIKKFGYSDEELTKFITNLTEFQKIDEANKNLSIKKENPYFVTIQKQIIDMFIMKKVNFHLLDQEIADFYNLLYTPDCSEPLRVSYNYLTAKDINEVKNYYEQEMASHEKIEEEATKNYLNNRAYEIMGYTMESIRSLSEEELEKMNHQVYDFFKIRENAINKEYLLEKAIEDHDQVKEPLMTGNGYVDILLVMGGIATIVMVGVILRFLVF